MVQMQEAGRPIRGRAAPGDEGAALSCLNENGQAPQGPTADLLSTTAVAKLLDITSDGVRMLDRRGRLRAFARLDGPHGPRVYDRVTVEKYAAERTARRTPPPPTCYSCEHFAQ